MYVEIPLQVCVDPVTNQAKSTHPGRSPRGWAALYYRTGRTNRTSRTSQRTPALTDLPRPPIPQERDRGCTPCGCWFHSHGSRGAAPMTRGSAGASYDNDPLWVAEQASPSCRSHKGCTACRPARDPDRGHFCIAQWSRHEVPKTPGYRRYSLYMRPRQGSLPRAILHYDRPLAGSRGKGSDSFPGVVGAEPLRPPGYEKRTPPGCLPAGRAISSDGADGALYCRTSRTVQRTPALTWEIHLSQPFTLRPGYSTPIERDRLLPRSILLPILEITNTDIRVH